MNDSGPARVGLLVGRERSFPDALIAEINTRNTGVVAEYVRMGHSTIDDPTRYRVLVDRISHEITYYQTFLKRAVVAGTHVINNPFWRIADDKFFGTTLASKLGIKVPRTVALPNKDYPPSIVAESLSNLVYPLDWEAIVEYTGLPAYLKPHWGGGWREVHRISTIWELLRAYDRSNSYCMILQEAIEWQEYIRCLCIGTSVLPVAWDPRRSHFERYTAAVGTRINPDTEARVIREARLINEAMGYEMNTVEFAIRNGEPYAIDFMNTAPDFDITSLGEEYFTWVVRELADLAIERASSPLSTPNYRWDALLGGRRGAVSGS